jgi:hypothetical protein
MSVHDYLRVCRLRGGPAGDFAHDARLDPTLPDIHSSRELIGYLRARGVHDAGVLAAARAFWVKYRRWQDRNPFSTSTRRETVHGR